MLDSDHKLGKYFFSMLFPEVHLELEREKVSSALCSGIWAYNFFLVLYLSISSLQFFMFLLFLRRVAFVRGPSSGGCWAPRSRHPPLLGGRSHSRASILFHLKNDPSSWFQNSRAPRGQPYRPTRWDVFFIKTLHQTKVSRLALLQPLSMLLGASNKAQPVH